MQHQFSSIQSLSRVRLCDPMNRSTPSLPVHHQLPEFRAKTNPPNQELSQDQLSHWWPVRQQVLRWSREKARDLPGARGAGVPRGWYGVWMRLSRAAPKQALTGRHVRQGIEGEGRAHPRVMDA